MTLQLTDTTWNNELARNSNFVEGHGWSEIMDNIKEGDKVIDGIGEVLICTSTLDLEKFSAEAGVVLGYTSLMVTLQPTKKDGTLHKGKASINFSNVGCSGWERD